MLKKVMADKLWREVRQALPDGAVEGEVVKGSEGRWDVGGNTSDGV